MSSSFRFFIICLVFGIGIFVFANVFRLMFVFGYKYKSFADINRVRKQFLTAKRGSIKDKYGEVLVQDVARGIEYVRKYEVGEEFGHILGYVGENTETLKKCGDIDGIQNVKKTGIGGIEEFSECALRGSQGVRYVEVNAQEKSNKNLVSIPSREGDEIILTIDSRLQKEAYTSFGSVPGAAIVLDAKSSEVLAIVSAPSFDPSKFGVDNGTTDKYLKDPKQPLFNRATYGIYPPGSVFKMVVASAALSEGKVKAEETVLDTGFRTVGDKKYANWLYTEYNGRTDGEVDMIKSLKRSNDIYYYEMGARLGVDLLAKYATIYRFGASTGIEIQDLPGIVPSAFWKMEKVGEKWFLGDTYNFSIGQGFLLVTPLQIASMTQTIANDGNYCSPTILSEDARYKNKENKRVCKRLPIGNDVFKIIKKGMEEACTIKGTAWTFFDINSPSEATTPAEFKHHKISGKVACKTGTAEHFVEGNEEPHGWLTLFAPAENPKIVITVLAEKGGQGSDSAGPIARKILDAAKDLGLW